MAVATLAYSVGIPTFIPPPKVAIRFRLLRDGEVTPSAKELRLYAKREDMSSVSAVFWVEPGSDGFTQTYRFDLATLLAQGEWLGMGLDDAAPRKVRSAYLSLAESGTYTFNITEPFDLYTLVGSGYLAGSFPGGITTVDGVPTAATVRVLYRPGPGQPGDGALVAEVQSAADGSWRVDDLDPALKFDVVGRKAWFNDVIMSNVSPKVD